MYIILVSFFVDATPNKCAIISWAVYLRISPQSSVTCNREYRRHVIKAKPAFCDVEVDGGYVEYFNIRVINRRRVKLDILWLTGASTQYFTAELMYSEYIFAWTLLNIKAVYINSSFFPTVYRFNSTRLHKIEEIMKIKKLMNFINFRIMI